ncbi:MAG: hypothetical protein ACRYGM_05275 [Janthinobacterium lividum]
MNRNELSAELDTLVQRFDGKVHSVQPRLPLHLLRGGHRAQKGGIGAAMGGLSHLTLDPASIIAAAAQISTTKLIILASVPVAIQFIRSSEKVLVAWLERNKLELRVEKTSHKLSRPGDVQHVLDLLEKASE